MHTKNLSSWSARLTGDQRSTLRTSGILVILVILASLISKGTFIQSQNIINILNQNAILMLVAFGQVLIIALGGIDLSVGAVMARTSVLVVYFQHLGMWASFGIALLAGALVGLVNAYLVVYRRLPAFIVTLATMEIVYSASKMVTGGAAIYVSSQNAQIDQRLLLFFKQSVGPVSYPVLCCIIVIAILSVFFRTRWGYTLFATGGNERAARISGISTARVKICAHIMTSVICVIGGILLVSRIGMGDPTTGSTQQLDSIAAVTIGGASMSGGTGTLAGTVIGVLILSVLTNIMSLLHIPTTIQPAIKGIIILIAVYFNTREKK